MLFSCRRWEEPLALSAGLILSASQHALAASAKSSNSRQVKDLLGVHGNHQTRRQMQASRCTLLSSPRRHRRFFLSSHIFAKEPLHSCPRDTLRVGGGLALPCFCLVVLCVRHKPNTVGGGGGWSTKLPPSLVEIKLGRVL